MKKHKIIVAGCGTMAHQWVDYAMERENTEIVAFVDVQIEAARNMAEAKDLQVPVFLDLAEAIDYTDATLVFDVTVPAVHKRIVTTALKKGCDVFGEKPMAESMADAEEVLETAKKTGRKYAVMQNRRYLKQIRAFENVLAGNTIGTLGSLHADYFMGPHFGGFRETMDHPLILDMAIHTFDQARLLTGANPVSVYCHAYNTPGSWYKGDASAACIFEMDNGTVFTYRGSWNTEGGKTSWESDWLATGSRGSARWNGEDMPDYEVIDETAAPAFFRKTKKAEAPDVWQGREAHAGCLDEMFASLEENRPAETECTDNIQSMAMVFGAIKSASTGQKIFL